MVLIAPLFARAELAQDIDDHNVVKSVDHYGERAHRLLADSGLASFLLWISVRLMPLSFYGCHNAPLS